MSQHKGIKAREGTWKLFKWLKLVEDNFPMSSSSIKWVGILPNKANQEEEQTSNTQEI